MHGNQHLDDTHSQEVIVLEHIQSDRSNKFTIESWPPEARYLYARLLASSLG